MSHPEIVRQATIKRIKSGSLFKLIFIISLSTLGPFILFCGIAALFGANTVTLGSNHATGIFGLISAIIMIPIFSGIFSGFAWVLSYVAIRIVGHFSPITIDYVSAVATEPNKAPEPTPMSVTPAADAPVAPDTGAAHL